MRRTFLVFVFAAAMMPAAASAAFKVRATAGAGLEGNAGSIAIVPITFSVSDPAHPTITADWQTVDGTATVADNDYKQASGSFTIPQGETSATIQVQVNGDNKVENDETFSVVVSNVKNSPPFPTVTITILNDDVPVVTVSSPSVPEGNSGTTAMTFDITLTPAAAVPVDVAYQTADGTATAGQDYQAVSGKVTFAPGETTKSVVVNVIGDTLVEPDETFSLIATPAATLASGPLPGPSATGIGTIKDDGDLPPLARIVIVSGNGQSGRLGQALAQPLVVEVQNARGTPVAGVAVQWKVTQGDALLTPAAGTTDAQGRASTILTLRSVGAIAVQASAAQLTPVTFALGATTSFESRATGPVAVPIARTLDQICARNETTFNDVCRALSTLTDDQLTPTLEHVAPQQSGAQSKVASEVVSAVVSGIGARLAALRSGTERFSIQRLSFNWNGRAVPFGALMKTFLAADVAAGEQNAGDYNGWSGFLSGNLGTGDRIGRDGQLGFDLRSRGLMLGVDRQVGHNVFGVSVNGMKLDSTLNDAVGSLDTTGYALSLYGSREGLFASATPAAGSGMHFDGVHLDGSLTAGRNRYDAEHVVDIPSLGTFTARSRNNANVYALTGVTGVAAHSGRTDVDAALTGTWSRAHIDDLSESGDGPLILFVQGHDIESVVGSASLNVRIATPVPFGTLLPTFRGELVHEFTSGARLVTARFLRDRLDTAFTIPIDRPDSNYGRLGIGLEAMFAYGWSAFIEATQDVLRSDLHFRTLQFNVHKAF